MKQVFTILAVFMLLSSQVTTVQAQCDFADGQQMQYDALAAIYNSTNGPSWTNNTNWLQDCDYCGWYGVTCDADGNVTTLNLQNNALSGDMPSLSSNLSSLMTLDLSGNQLTGNIPAQLGELTSLEYLYLYDNMLSEDIPNSLANLTNLKKLNLSTNQLVGIIPSEFSNLSNLTHLNLFNNQLVGTIPASLTGLTNLKQLYLSSNQLMGTIPPFSAASLQELYLANNQLSGAIPSSLGSTGLKYLYLSNNQLSGAMPDAIAGLSNLQALSVHNNMLTAIPDNLGDLAGLSMIFLQDNQILCLPASMHNKCTATVNVMNNPVYEVINTWGEFCDMAPAEYCYGDADEDGVLDHVDNCPNTANPDQADTDNDGVGDVCDFECTDVTYSIDGNDLTLANISAPHAQIQIWDIATAQRVFICTDCNDATQTMPDLADGNLRVMVKYFNDEWGVICERTFDIMSEGPCADAGGDSDGDGVCDANDNCPYSANADQADANNNGVGDVCEPCANEGGDSDGDGVCDANDNCPNTANPDQADSDNDGIGDACDDTDNNTTGCDAVTVTSGEGSIYVNNLNAPVVQLQVFDLSDWSTVFSCLDGSCNQPSQVINGLAQGEYQVLVKYYNTDPNWALDCERRIDITVSQDADPCAAAGGDSDGDGVCDADDNCPYTANADQADMDNDGLGDVCDDYNDNDDDDLTHDCNNASITTGANSMTIGNLTAPIVEVQVFSLPSWTTVLSCTQGDCDLPVQEVSGLAEGNYHVLLKYRESNWALIGECRTEHYVGGAPTTSSTRPNVEDFSVFPNPSSEFLNVDLSNFNGASSTIQVFNSTGNQVKYINIEEITEDPVNIQLNNFAEGIYNISVNVDGKEQMTKTFVVKKF